jgi:hypothetical protein
VGKAFESKRAGIVLQRLFCRKRILMDPQPGETCRGQGQSQRAVMVVDHGDLVALQPGQQRGRRVEQQPVRRICRVEVLRLHIGPAAQERQVQFRQDPPTPCRAARPVLRPR